MLNKVLYLVFSVIVTVTILGYLLSRVPLTEVLGAMRSADPRGVAMFVFLSLAGSAFRMWRYELALGASGYRPPRFALFLVVLVRNFFSDLLPARIGTVIYVYMVTSRLGIPLGPAASSFALAFLFDILALVPLLLLAASLVGSVAEIPIWGLVVGSGILLVTTLAVLRALPWGLDRIAGWLRKKETLPKAEASLSEAATDLRLVKEQKLYNRLLALSLAVRVCKYGSLYVFLFALLAPMGYSWGDLEIPKVFMGICAAELAASLPISGVAGFGVYEGTWALVFRVIGFPGAIADLTAISHHLFTQVYGYGLGALALLTLLLPRFARVPSEMETNTVQSPGWLFYLRLGTAVLFIVVVLLVFNHIR